MTNVFHCSGANPKAERKYLAGSKPLGCIKGTGAIPSTEGGVKELEVRSRPYDRIRTLRAGNRKPKFGKA